MDPAPPPRNRLKPLAILATGILLVGWRAAVLPLEQVWRDWIVILAAYGAYGYFRRDSRAWPIVTAGVSAFLLGIYIQGQCRHLLTVLGLAS